MYRNMYPTLTLKQFDPITVVQSKPGVTRVIQPYPTKNKYDSCQKPKSANIFGTISTSDISAILTTKPGCHGSYIS